MPQLQMKAIFRLFAGRLPELEGLSFAIINWAAGGLLLNTIQVVQSTGQ